MRWAIGLCLLAATVVRAEPRLEVTRLGEGPILSPEMMPQDDGEWSNDLNFPSVIRVPAWVEHPLGKYYCYFSAHHGTYIRMAYADRVEGPWKVYAPGALRLEEVERVNGVTERIADRHVASPDVHVDEERGQIRMYFHFLLPKLGHKGSVATSADGLHFEPRPGTLSGPYLRVFKRDGAYWGLDDRGGLVKSPDGIEAFKPLSDAVRRVASAGKVAFRHGGVFDGGGDAPWFLYTRIGDAPERIFATRVRMSGDPAAWAAAEPVELLRPERPWEGAAYDDVPSTFRGQTKVRQLRDPFVYREGGRTYLFYAVAGETGIGLAEIKVSGE